MKSVDNLNAASVIFFSSSHSLSSWKKNIQRTCPLNDFTLIFEKFIKGKVGNFSKDIYFFISSENISLFFLARDVFNLWGNICSYYFDIYPSFAFNSRLENLLKNTPELNMQHNSHYYYYNYYY